MTPRLPVDTGLDVQLICLYLKVHWTLGLLRPLITRKPLLR